MSKSHTHTSKTSGAEVRVPHSEDPVGLQFFSGGWAKGFSPIPKTAES